MAKDKGGHGSEARGGGMGRSEFASQPVQGAKFQARQSMKAANNPNSWEARYGTKMDQDRLRADAINQGVDVGFKSSLKEAGVSDKQAAASLAGGGAKSAPVDVHPSMNAFQPNKNSSEYHSYNRDLALRSKNGQVGSGMKFRG